MEEVKPYFDKMKLNIRDIPDSHCMNRKERRKQAAIIRKKGEIKVKIIERQEE